MINDGRIPGVVNEVIGNRGAQHVDTKMLQEEKREELMEEMANIIDRLTIRLYQDGKAAWEFAKGREIFDKYQRYKLAKEKKSGE